jgi:hypothetical protein
MKTRAPGGQPLPARVTDCPGVVVLGVTDNRTTPTGEDAAVVEGGVVAVEGDVVVVEVGLVVVGVDWVVGAGTVLTLGAGLIGTTVG